MDENETIKCKCKTCGKVFNKGDEGDNEIYCLRCERISIISDDFDNDNDYE